MARGLGQLASARFPRGRQPGTTQGAGAPGGGGTPQLAPWQRKEQRLGAKVTAGTASQKQAQKYQQFQSGRELQSTLAENDPRRLANPRKLYKRAQGAGAESHWPAWRRMQNVETAKEALGYNEPTDTLTDRVTADLEAGSPVDLHMERAPLVGGLQEYAMSRLGTGLTPEEEAAIRGRMKDVTEGAARTSERGESARLSAAGIDPRSGIAASRMAGIANERARGLADAEREITLQDLARKGDIESLATAAGGLGERAREFDVGAEEGAEAHDENTLYALAGLKERGFENLLDYTESARQAKKSRQSAREAAAALEPGALEYTGTILGSLL